ncbi:Ubiquitin carboxyl-terminal hydrolase, partial [Coniochaeta hoffmannii]
MVPSPCKAFLPLESNPTVFNELIQLLGVSPRLAFEDIFSLDDNPDLLLSRPALALILVFPADDVLEADALSDRPAYAGFGSEEPVLWFRQTIQNACGLYAVLHAVCNGAARGYIETDGPLAGLLERAVPLSPADRAKVLEDSAELEGAHAAVAVKGDSAVPGSAEEEVEFHYVAFVGGQDGRVWELDGDRKGPVET